MSLLERHPHASEPSVDFLRKPAFLPNSLREEGAVCSVLPTLGGLQLSEVRAWIVPCRNSGHTVTIPAKALLPGPTAIPAVALQVPKRDGFFFPQASPPCSRSRSYWQCIYQLSRSSRQQMGTEVSCNASRQSPARKAQHFPPGEAAGPGAQHASAAQERMQPALGLSIPPGAGNLLLVMLRGEDPSKLEGPRAESPSCKHSPAQK